MNLLPTREEATLGSMKKMIVVVGAGIVGASIAWHLACL